MDVMIVITMTDGDGPVVVVPEGVLAFVVELRPDALKLDWNTVVWCQTSRVEEVEMLHYFVPKKIDIRDLTIVTTPNMYRIEYRDTQCDDTM